MPRKRRLMTSNEAKPAKVQHKHPCCDCPFHRDALAGWLGGSTPEQYLAWAHQDTVVDCHTKLGQQCAGMAIYRANVIKSCRPPMLELPADKSEVFSTPMEFLEHHKQLPDGSTPLPLTIRPESAQ